MEKLINDVNKILSDLKTTNLAEANNQLVRDLVQANNEEEIKEIESKINLINMRIALDLEN